MQIYPIVSITRSHLFVYVLGIATCCEEQISLARKRNLNVDFRVGDLTAIDAANDTFDAVFIFGVLHHIPEWRTAIAEVARVLKAGGVLLVEEPRERFTWEQFESGMNHAGLDILAVDRVFFNYFRAYLCQVQEQRT